MRTPTRPKKAAFTVKKKKKKAKYSFILLFQNYRFVSASSYFCPSLLLCACVVISGAEVTDDVNSNMTATRSMLHNNSILSVYFIMLHSLVDVRIASVFI